MASQIDVYNLALTLLDVSETVQSVNDNTLAAGVLNRYYDHARRLVLEKAWWDFATIMVPLSLLLDQSTVASQAQIYYPGWRYVYQRPADAIRSLAVTTQYGARINPFTRSWWYDMSQAPQWGPYRPPYREVLDMVGSPQRQAIDILTDQDNAWYVYVADVTNVNLWTESFKLAVAWNLAMPAAGPISAKTEARELAVKMAEKSITDALAVTLNQKQEDPYPDSPAITARN